MKISRKELRQIAGELYRDSGAPPWSFLMNAPDDLDVIAYEALIVLRYALDEALKQKPRKAKTKAKTKATAKPKRRKV